jgi:hypothetical protein
MPGLPTSVLSAASATAPSERDTAEAARRVFNMVIV